MAQAEAGQGGGSRWRGWFAALPVLVVYGVLVGTLPMPARAQDTAQFDRPFTQPQYLIHVTKRGTRMGDVVQDSYLLYPQKPDAMGNFLMADGSGGTIGFSSDFHTGPLATPRSVCAAAAGRGLPAQSWTPYNFFRENFDCRALPAPGASSGQAIQATAPPSGGGISSTLRPIPTAPALGGGPVVATPTVGATTSGPESSTVRTYVFPVGVAVGVLIFFGGAAAVWWTVRTAATRAAAAELAAAAAPAVLPAATVPSGLTWGTVIAEKAAEATYLLTQSDRVGRLAALGHYQAKIALALRALHSGAQLTAEQYKLLRDAGFLP